jgi:hypothetical protein
MNLPNVVSHNAAVYDKVSVTLNENFLYFIKTVGCLIEIDSKSKTLSYMREKGQNANETTLTSLPFSAVSPSPLLRLLLRSFFNTSFLRIEGQGPS